MTAAPEATYQQWMDAYQRAYVEPGAVPTMACPHCGEHRLHLEFLVNRVGDERGTAVFWCDACLRGLIPLPAPVPSAAVVTLRDVARVPNYTIVPETD